MESVVRLLVSDDMLAVPPGQFETDEDRRSYADKCYDKRRREVVCGGVSTISSVEGQHPDHIWEAASEWHVDYFYRPPSGTWSVPYLKKLGYAPSDTENWEITPGTGGSDPELSFHIADRAHEEHSGHTWYLIQCSLMPRGGEHRLGWNDDDADKLSGVFRGHKWLAPRRMTQFREILYEPVMVMIADTPLVSRFADAPFPMLTAPRGTTARLHAWLQVLADLINGGCLAPALVAWTLMFFLPCKPGVLPGIPLPSSSSARTATQNTAVPGTRGVGTPAGYGAGQSAVPVTQQQLREDEQQFRDDSEFLARLDVNVNEGNDSVNTAGLVPQRAEQAASAVARSAVAEAVTPEEARNPEHPSPGVVRTASDIEAVRLASATATVAVSAAVTAVEARHPQCSPAIGIEESVAAGHDGTAAEIPVFSGS